MESSLLSTHNHCIAQYDLPPHTHHTTTLHLSSGTRQYTVRGRGPIRNYNNAHNARKKASKHKCQRQRQQDPFYIESKHALLPTRKERLSSIERRQAPLSVKQERDPFPVDGVRLSHPSRRSRFLLCRWGVSSLVNKEGGELLLENW